MRKPSCHGATRSDKWREITQPQLRLAPAPELCRQLLADPNWVNKLQSGNAAKIHRCVRCNKKCLGGLIAHQGTRCIYDALNAKEQGSI